MASPIEAAMFDALCAAATRRNICLAEPLQDELVSYGDERTAVRHAIVQRDHAVSSYRIDILIRGGCWVHTGAHWSLAVECDGHDFHDRTKQQAAYDRARDRELLLRGITTIRFTGSEISHSVERCANDAIRVLEYLDDHANLVLGLLDRCGELHRREL